MIFEPHVYVEPLNLTVACAFHHVAVTFVGAFGTPAGMTLFEALLITPLPIAFTAFTVNV